eukprot:4882087-Pleurochrysis_carterae.AAC.3
MKVVSKQQLASSIKGVAVIWSLYTYRIQVSAVSRALLEQGLASRTRAQNRGANLCDQTLSRPGQRRLAD